MMMPTNWVQWCIHLFIFHAIHDDDYDDLGYIILFENKKKSVFCLIRVMIYIYES